MKWVLYNQMHQIDRGPADGPDRLQMEVRGEQWGLCATDSTNVSARL